MKKTQTIFLLEDQVPQRLALKQMLQRRDFQIDDAGTVQEARQLIQKGREYDVAVLDMRLEDKGNPHLTGADVGLELARIQRSKSPEFLTYSAYPSVLDYYQQALKLGAATFLDKAQDLEGHEVVRHIRVLALRRLLSTRGHATQDIQDIAQTSRTPTEAVTRFCREVLSHALRGTLGAPFVLLITDPQQPSHAATLPCEADIPLPQERLKVYQYIQNLIFLPGNVAEPFKIDPAELLRAGIENQEEVLEHLRGTSFIPLTTSQGIRLSLGIVQEEKEKNRLAEDADRLARLAARYFRNSVLDHLLGLTAVWTKYEAQRRATLRTTSSFCLRIGQEQIAIIDDALRSGTDRYHHSMKKLQELGEELRDVGEILAELDEDSAPSKEACRMKDLVQEAWADWTETTDISGRFEFSLTGNCVCYGDKEDIQQAVSSIIGWFIQRLIGAPPDDTRPYLRVYCEEGEAGPLSKVVFEDSSLRLEKALRDSLFDPLSSDSLSQPVAVDRARGQRLGLYMAKAIVEIRNGGYLEDRSDDLDGDFGHRIVMSFPIRQGVPAEI